MRPRGTSQRISWLPRNEGAHVLCERLDGYRATARIATHDTTRSLGDERRDHFTAITLARDAIDPLGQAEGDRNGGGAPSQKEHHLVAQRECRRANHHPAVAADLTARHSECDRAPAL